MITATVDTCWNRTGISGDGSCPELKSYVHCRNCPVFSSAGRRLLDCAAPKDYVKDWTNLLAVEKENVSAGRESAVIFRLGPEWLALPVHLFKEVMPMRVIHRLPHKSNGILLGMANIRGELQLCVSLKRILGIEEGSPDESGGDGDRSRISYRRLVVVEKEPDQWVIPVDEIQGVQRFERADLGKVPATIAKAAVKFTSGMLSSQGRSVGLLDDELLFYTLRHSALAQE